ncbi:alpha/beta hydrolase [Proteobacteria bacterium 005FR1]|nr:alpha/beta hydrolase [Proteobacteria bacterium 005FR1]
MQHEEDFFTGRHGKKIFRQWWLPSGEPQAIMLIVHGLAEHSGRYRPLVHHFVPMGYAVYGFDHLGHGKSEGPRCHADAIEDFTENLQRMVLWVKERHPGKKLILFGHSMGGLITANYLIDHQQEVNETILSAPAIMSSAEPTLGQKIKVGLLHRIRPRAQFRKLDPEGISRDSDVVQDYRNDPLVHTGPMSIGLALVLGGAMSRARRDAAQITLPVLIVQGGHDLLVDPKGAKALFESIGSQRKHLKYYPDAYHELLNEPEAPLVLGLIENWLAGSTDLDSGE